MATANDITLPGSAKSTRALRTCDKCSDPACEHKLLSDLLLNR